MPKVTVPHEVLKHLDKMVEVGETMAEARHRYQNDVLAVHHNIAGILKDGPGLDALPLSCVHLNITWAFCRSEDNKFMIKSIPLTAVAEPVASVPDAENAPTAKGESDE